MEKAVREQWKDDQKRKRLDKNYIWTAILDGKAQ